MGKGAYIALTVGAVAALLWITGIAGGLERKIAARPTQTPQAQAAMTAGIEFNGDFPPGMGRLDLEAKTNAYSLGISPAQYCQDLLQLNPDGDAINYWRDSKNRISDCSPRQKSGVRMYLPVYSQP